MAVCGDQLFPQLPHFLLGARDTPLNASLPLRIRINAQCRCHRRLLSSRRCKHDAKCRRLETHASAQRAVAHEEHLAVVSFSLPAKGLLQQALQLLTVLFVFLVLPPSGSPLHGVVSLFPPPGAPQQLAGTKSALLLCPGCLRSWANLFFRLQELSPPQQSLRFVFSLSLPELPAAIIVGFVFLQGLRSWSAFGFSPVGNSEGQVIGLLVSQFCCVHRRTNYVTHRKSSRLSVKCLVLQYCVQGLASFGA